MSLATDDPHMTGPLAEDYTTQTAQFLQFTRWFRGAAVVFGLLAVVAAVGWRDAWMGVTAFAVLDFAGWLTVARYWLRDYRRRHRAVITVCLGLVVNSLIILFAQPVLFPTLLIAAILPLTLSLQYARPSHKTVCMTLATLLIVVIATGGRFHMMPSAIPDWFIALYEISSVAVVGAVFLLLITQAGTRLFDRLDEVERARREAETAKQDLALEHARLAALVDSQQDGVVAADRQGHVTLMNPAAEALTGWTLDEARTRHVADVVRLETSRETTEELWERVLRDGRPFLQTGDVALINRDGERIPVAATAAPIRDSADSREHRDEHAGADDRDEAGGSATSAPALYGGVLTFRDMTQQLEILARLRQTERFDLIQGMAGIVGRDVRHAIEQGRDSSDPYGSRPYQDRRNRAGAIAIEEPTDDPDAVPFGVTESFLALGRQARLSPRPFNPTHLLYQVALSLPHMLGKHVLIFVKPGKNVGKAYADFDRTRDVLLQLALAARRSMATGGTVHLLTAREEIDDATDRFILGKLAPGTYVRIDVRDSGCGYTRDQLLRLFEPFQFTTHKDVDQSLRLAATYGTIRQNAGALAVESRPQVGSTFSVFLPAFNPLTMARSNGSIGRI